MAWNYTKLVLALVLGFALGFEVSNPIFPSALVAAGVGLFGLAAREIGFSMPFIYVPAFWSATRLIAVMPLIGFAAAYMIR